MYGILENTIKINKNQKQCTICYTANQIINILLDYSINKWFSFLVVFVVP